MSTHHNVGRSWVMFAMSMALAAALALLSAGTATAQPVPSEAGNDAFGTVQEIVAILEADASTDWTRVDLEALRQHLLDMRDMTLNVVVESQESIPNGSRSVVRPTTERAADALTRIFQGHPHQLMMESGWSMKATESDGSWIITTTTSNASEVDRLRGLGYIGLMAAGNHHQAHHLAIAKGDDPHAGHH